MELKAQQIVHRQIDRHRLTADGDAHGDLGVRPGAAQLAAVSQPHVDAPLRLSQAPALGRHDLADVRERDLQQPDAALEAQGACLDLTHQDLPVLQGGAHRGLGGGVGEEQGGDVKHG